ncbi:MAG: hypothetical protein ACQESR_29970 [Planctomycetota bacterium]
MESDEHFYTVLGYVERNPVRAGLVERSEDWTWSSEWAGPHPDNRRALPLCNWPLLCPEDWPSRVNEPLTEGEINAVQKSAERGSPHGQRDWVKQTAKALDRERTLRPPQSPPEISPILISQTLL